MEQRGSSILWRYELDSCGPEKHRPEALFLVGMCGVSCSRRRAFEWKLLDLTASSSRSSNSSRKETTAGRTPPVSKKRFGETGYEPQGGVFLVGHIRLL